MGLPVRSARPEVDGDDGDATADGGVGRELAERRARSGKKGKKGQGERGEAGERHGALLIVQGPRRHGARGGRGMGASGTGATVREMVNLRKTPCLFSI